MMNRSLAAALLLLVAPLNAFSPSGMAVKRSTAMHAATGMDGPLKMIGQKQDTRKVTQAERNKMEDVMIEPDYKLAGSMAALCPLIIAYHPSKFVLLPGPPNNRWCRKPELTLLVCSLAFHQPFMKTALFH
jgi:hypothetical protein